MNHCLYSFRQQHWAALTCSVMREQEGTVLLIAAAKCLCLLQFAKTPLDIAVDIGRDDVCEQLQHFAVCITYCMSCVSVYSIHSCNSDYVLQRYAVIYSLQVPVVLGLGCCVKISAVLPY